jgi:hypothetical protein
VKPWLTDSMYGGMSEESARCSYEAWARQGSKPLKFKDPPASDREIEFRKRQIAVLLHERAAAIAAAAAWMDGWKSRQRQRGFRCIEEG